RRGSPEYWLCCRIVNLPADLGGLRSPSGPWRYRTPRATSSAPAVFGVRHSGTRETRGSPAGYVEALSFPLAWHPEGALRTGIPPAPAGRRRRGCTAAALFSPPHPLDEERNEHGELAILPPETSRRGVARAGGALPSRSSCRRFGAGSGNGGRPVALPRRRRLAYPLPAGEPDHRGELQRPADRLGVERVELRRAGRVSHARYP